MAQSNYDYFGDAIRLIVPWLMKWASGYGCLNVINLGYLILFPGPCPLVSVQSR